MGHAPKLLVLGLDGATFDILNPLFAAGKLPTLQRLCREGTHSVLRSTVPPVTFPAWSTFLTGVSPSEHGLTDIFMRDGYGLAPANAKQRTLPTFLHELSARGLRVVSLGVPTTYPPEEVNGVVVSGFDAPGAAFAGKDAVHPPERYSELKSLGGWRYATFNEQAGGENQAVDALLKDIASKEKIARHFVRDPWDVFFSHLQASDTIGHHMWHDWDPVSPRNHGTTQNAVARVYARLDALIGRLIQDAPQDTQVLVVSDHGMGGASDVAVYLNRWLHHQGWLTFKNEPLKQTASKLMQQVVRLAPPSVVGLVAQNAPDALRKQLLGVMRHGSIDLSRTVAFSDELDYCPSIWIHRRSRFTQGLVGDTQVGPLIDAICAKLEQLTFNGQPIVRKIHRRSELPNGPGRERFADILIEPNWLAGYRPSFLRSPNAGPDIRVLTRKERLAGRGHGMPGVHHPDGIFVAWGKNLEAQTSQPLEMHQAGQAVYAMLNQPLPSYVSDETPRFLAKNTTATPIRVRPPVQTTEPPALSAATIERLRALGYLA